MRQLFFVVDIANLRESERELHLQKLWCAVARTWTTYFKPDITFGYKIYDSANNDFLIESHVQRIATALNLPSQLRAASSTNLSGESLPDLLSLLEKITDESFLKSLRLRLPSKTVTRKGGRAEESTTPANGVRKALQAILGGSYFQKLAPTESTESENSDALEGTIVIFTSEIVSGNKSAFFFGADGSDTLDDEKLKSAALQHIPEHIWSAISTLQTRIVWITSDDDNEDSRRILSEVGSYFSSFSRMSVSMLSMKEITEENVTKEEFSKQTRLPITDEASTEFKNYLHLWPRFPITLESIKSIIATLEEPYNGKATAEGRRKLKSRSKTRSKPKDSATGPEKEDNKSLGRGSRLIARARNSSFLLKANTSSQQNAKNTEILLPIDLSEAKPCTLDDAVNRVHEGIKELIKQITCDDEKGPAGPSAAASAALTVKKVIENAITGALAFESASDESSNSREHVSLLVSDLRIAFLTRCTEPSQDLKAAHHSCKQAERSMFGWRCALQVLLRLYISAFGAASGARLPAPIFQDVEALISLLVATMRPIPTGGQRFFTELIQPTFGSIFSADIALLERHLFEEDGDGDMDETAASLRAQQASLEVIGETPGSLRGNWRGFENASMDNDGISIQLKTQKAPNTIHDSVGLISSGKSLMSECNSGGSEVNASGSTAAASRRSGMLNAEFMGRRFSNASQFRMAVRVAPRNARTKKSGTRPVLKAQNEDKTKAKVTVKNAQQSLPEVEKPNNDNAYEKRKEAVPATPEDVKRAVEKFPNDTESDRRAIDSTKAFDAQSPRNLMKGYDGIDVEAIPNTSPRSTKRPVEYAAAFKQTIRQPCFDNMDICSVQNDEGSTIEPFIETLVDPSNNSIDEIEKPKLQAANWFKAAVVTKGQTSKKVQVKKKDKFKIKEVDGLSIAAETNGTQDETHSMNDQSPVSDDRGNKGVNETSNDVLNSAEKVVKSKAKNTTEKPIEDISLDQLSHLQDSKTEAQNPERHNKEFLREDGKSIAMNGAISEDMDDENKVPDDASQGNIGSSGQEIFQTNDENISPGSDIGDIDSNIKRQQFGHKVASTIQDKENCGENRDGVSGNPRGDTDSGIVNSRIPCHESELEQKKLDKTDCNDNAVLAEVCQHVQDDSDQEFTSPPPRQIGTNPNRTSERNSPQIDASTPKPLLRSGKRTPLMPGKRLLGASSKTPATKRGRLAGMNSYGKVKSLAKQSPTVLNRVIEDMSSPAKPSPYSDDFALAASPAKAEIEATNKSGQIKRKQGKARSKRFLPMASLSPKDTKDQHNLTSDEEDNDILTRAAKGALSPSNFDMDENLHFHSPSKSIRSEEATYDPTPTAVHKNKPSDETGTMDGNRVVKRIEFQSEDVEEKDDKKIHVENSEHNTAQTVPPKRTKKKATPAKKPHARQKTSSAQKRTRQTAKKKAHQDAKMENGKGTGKTVEEIPDCSQYPDEVPSVGSDIWFASTFASPFLPIKCRIVKRLEIEKPKRKNATKWKVRVQAAPLPLSSGSALLTLVLCSNLNVTNGNSLVSAEQWMIADGNSLTYAEDVKENAVPVEAQHDENKDINLNLTSEDPVAADGKDLSNTPKTRNKRTREAFEETPPACQYRKLSGPIDFSRSNGVHALTGEFGSAFRQRRHSMSYSEEDKSPPLSIREENGLYGLPKRLSSQKLIQDKNPLEANVSPLCLNYARDSFGSLYKGASPVSAADVHRFIKSDALPYR